MRGLIKYLSPFAPDQSGACAVLYELGGIMVICDAGGCTGNICGFDEARWFNGGSAIFSAGLRDMDAILGRDDKLISKLALAAQDINAEFAAIIGTPVPAVIGTDFKALKRMSEKRASLPTLTVECTGTGMYDEGEEKAYTEIFQLFAKEKTNVKKGSVNVIGVTPLDFSCFDAAQKLSAQLNKSGFSDVRCIGFGSTLKSVREASSAEKNIVVSPAGIKAAEFLKEKFGTPFEMRCPFIWDDIKDKIENFGGKKVLVIHQQFAAEAVRREIEKNSDAQVDTASWFNMEQSMKRGGDFHIDEEKEFAQEVYSRNYDVIIADKYLKRALKNFGGEFVDFRHFAVSGRMEAQE